jgi:hypothetical protein
VRKSFKEIFTPAISRRKAFTSFAVTMCSAPSAPRYWNSRRPGSALNTLMALASRAQ